MELAVISIVTSCQEQFFATTGAEANDKSTDYTIFSLTWLLRETLKVLFIVKGRHNITQLSVTR